MNPTPIPFNIPQQVAMASSSPTPHDLPTTGNKAKALTYFKKVKQDLRDRDLKEIIIEATTSAGLTMVVLSSKETKLKIKVKGVLVTYSCNMDTAECTIDGNVATDDDIKKFQALSNEVQTATDNGDARVHAKKKEF